MSLPRLRSLALVFAGGAMALVVGACSGAAGPSWSFTPASAAVATAARPAAVQLAAAQPAAKPSPAAAQAAAYAPSSPTTRLDLTIVTGDMIGKTEFPAYVPSDFSLPADSTVIVTITNFDDATPLTGGATLYATAQGLVGGTFTVTPIDAKDPNGSAGASQTLTALDPAQVSHTFTIPTLGINVPIAAHARVTFTIHTGAPGTFAWRCFDPCGADPAGWGTAMAAQKGYMEGTLTVTD